MKLVGKIFLIIAGIIFLGEAVFGVISNIQAGLPAATADAWFGFILNWLIVLVAFFGGLGAIFYAIGVGPFRGWVAPIAVIMLVIWIMMVVSASIQFANNPSPSNIWPCFSDVIIIAPGEALYVLGWLFSRKK
jgi:hypothetical protein